MNQWEILQVTTIPLQVGFEYVHYIFLGFFNKHILIFWIFIISIWMCTIKKNHPVQAILKIRSSVEI